MGVNAIRGARFRVVEVADGGRAQAMVYVKYNSKSTLLAERAMCSIYYVNAASNERLARQPLLPGQALWRQVFKQQHVHDLRIRSSGTDQRLVTT